MAKYHNRGEWGSYLKEHFNQQLCRPWLGSSWAEVSDSADSVSKAYLSVQMILHRT